MGALAGKMQQEEVKNQIQKILASPKLFMALDSVGRCRSKDGRVMSPMLLMNKAI
jgi:hypothetical protein